MIGLSVGLGVPASGTKGASGKHPSDGCQCCEGSAFHERRHGRKGPFRGMSPSYDVPVGSTGHNLEPSR